MTIWLFFHAGFMTVFKLCAWGRGEHLFSGPRRNTEGHGELLFCPRRNADGRGRHQGPRGFSLRSCAALRCSAPICTRKSLFRQSSTSPGWYSSSHPSFQHSHRHLRIKHAAVLRDRVTVRHPGDVIADHAINTPTGFANDSQRLRRQQRRLVDK